MAHVKDRGFKSRKLLLVLWTQAQIVGVTIAAVRWPALVPVLPGLSGALLAAAGLYITGNVAEEHLSRKASPAPRREEP